MMPSTNLPSTFTLSTNLESYTTNDTIMISVYVPNPDNSTSLVIKILGPDYNLKDLHTFSPDPNQVGYTWTVIPNGPLFYNSGNYTVLAQYGQDHAVTSFYLHSTQGDIVLLGNLSSPLQHNVEIQNIQVQPSAVKVGDTLKITATLVNNSPDPIFVSDIGSHDCEGPFFTLMFDNHVKVKNNGIACSYVAFVERLDPGKKYTGTSPGLALAYIATEAGTANATVTFPYSVKNQTDPNQSEIEKTISKSFLFTINDNSTGTKTTSQLLRFYGNGSTITITLDPLEQVKSGILASKVVCNQGFQLVIKSEDGSPACVKPDSISKLILRGWISTTPSLDQNPEIFGNFYQGIESDAGIVSIKNQTYYMMTATNIDSITLGMSVQFHQVTFSFPYGSLTTPGGAIIPFDMTFPDGTTESYGNLTQNEASGIGLGPGPSSNRTNTVLSDHMHPQAGVTMTEDQIKLLVSTDVDTTQTQTSQNTTLLASFGLCNTPYELKEGFIPVLYMPANSLGKICVNYSNPNNPKNASLAIFEASSHQPAKYEYSSIQPAKSITTWAEPSVIPIGNSTEVYFVKTGNQTGFYGLTVFCVGMPFAVGYDNQSRIVLDDFPWMKQTTAYCLLQDYSFQVVGVDGIGIKYIPYP